MFATQDRAMNDTESMRLKLVGIEAYGRSNDYAAVTAQAM
jgi:hypothetical protein